MSLPRSASSEFAENRSVMRALKILESLGDSRVSLSVAEISRRTGLHRATTHRLVTVLHGLGYVYRNSETLTYTTGFYLHTLGTVRHVVDTVVEAARPSLARLASRLELTVYLGALNGVQSYICDCVAYPAGEPTVRLGRRLDAHASAIGLALLAYQPVDDVVQMYEDYPLRVHAPQTISNLNELLRALHQVRVRGFAFDDEGLRSGERSIGAAIVNPYGRATCALAVRGPLSRLPDKVVQNVAGEVKATAAAIADFLLKS